jgi:hypothetical protein
MPPKSASAPASPYIKRRQSPVNDKPSFLDDFQIDPTLADIPEYEQAMDLRFWVHLDAFIQGSSIRG